VVGAVIEALRDGGLEGNVSLKRLLGHVDREMRRLQDAGEQGYSAAPPVELINNLLYYVARAQSAGRASAACVPRSGWTRCWWPASRRARRPTRSRRRVCA